MFLLKFNMINLKKNCELLNKKKNQKISLVIIQVLDSFLTYIYIVLNINFYCKINCVNVYY